MLRTMSRLEVLEAPSTSDQPASGLRRNRRRNPRVRIDLPVKFKLEDASFVPARTVDYSESGVFVATTAPPPAGSWILLRLTVAGDTVDVEALVVRIVSRPSREQQAGFAAEFVVLPRRIKNGIVRLLAACDADAERPEAG